MSFFNFRKNKKVKTKKNNPSDNSYIYNSPYLNEEISTSFKKDKEYIEKIFCYPDNKDFIVRDIYIKALKKNANIFFLDGMANEQIIINDILHPLMEDTVCENIKGNYIENLIKAKQIYKTNKVSQIVNEIIMGYTILMIDGYKEVFSIETTKFEHRSVEKATRENTIRGPQEAFVESKSINVSLIRKRLRSEKLVTENIMVGERSKNKVSIMYLRDLASPELVKEIKKRISEIQADTIHSVDILEQHLEERPYSLIPSIQFTERPDRATAFLMEGHVVLIMDSSSDVLILPTTFWGLFHTGEDIYQRWAYGNFMRVVRLFAIFATLLTPALYVAITNFHGAMLPTDLLLAVAATRERVPFPVIVEVLLMESAFELLREAGVRIPTSIGPTIGIVGALILGQAAVEANIVSPILVIVVAITGLSSFAIPNNSLNFAVRISRFIFLFLGAFMGIFGIVIGLSMTIAYLTSYKSFEVPFLAPLAPHYKSSRDLILREPIWKQVIRPLHIKPQDNIRKKSPKGRSDQ